MGSAWLWTATSRVLALKNHSGTSLLSHILRIGCFKDLQALGGEMLSPPPKKKPVCSLFYQRRAKNHYKNLALGWLHPSWGLPFAPGSGRLRRPSAAPEIGWADGFSVAESILGLEPPALWRGGRGRARGGPSPPHPDASPARDGAGSGRVAWEDAQGVGGYTCPTRELPLLFPTSAFALGVFRTPPKPFFGGNLAYFCWHLVYCVVSARRAAAPIAAASGRSNEVPPPARRRAPEIHQKHIPSCEASTPSLGAFLGVSIRRLVMKNPFIAPNEAACCLPVR